MLNKMKFGISCVLLLFICYKLNAQPSYSAEKVLAFTRMGQASVSPDGQALTFITLQVKNAVNGKKWQTSLYLRDKAKKITLITRSWGPTLAPQWTPDGKQVTYLAKGTKAESIWAYNLHTHHHSKLFEFKHNITAFRWSPNQNYIAFVSTDAKRTTSLKHVNSDENNVRLYLVDMRNTVKTAQALTPANMSITQAAGNGLIDSGFSWAPSNATLAFAYQAKAGATDMNQSKIALFDLQTRRIATIPYTNQYVGNQPIYSPNGKWIAFRASSRKQTSLENNPFAYSRICISNTASLKTHCLPNTTNAAATILGWNKQSSEVFVYDDAQVFGPQIYALPLNSKLPVRLISKKHGYIDPTTISMNRGHNFFAFSYEKPNQAPTIVTTSTNHYALQTLHLPLQTAPKLLGHVKVIHWKSNDGKVIQGLLITPVNYNAHKKYPLLVIAHGGPAGASVVRYFGGCEEYGEAIVPHCSANLLSLGFIIFEPNPRGSTGYGQAFRFANIGDLGGGDYRDIMSGINYLVKQNIADAKHLAIFGWSYGGYMTAWSITQTPRFKAAIDGDGLTDLLSFTGTSDILWFLPQYLGNTFWHNASLYLQRSPIMYTKNINTPLLMLHGENDVRVPPAQAYELYTALKLQHKKVKLLLAPEQHHVPTNPNVTAAQIKAVDAWLQQALK